MKELITILGFLTIGLNVGNAQSCGDQVFHSQSEIDAFALNNPDCISISGSLTLDGDDIVNLDGLSSIKFIEVHLRIINTSLTNLDGLDSLYSVDLQVQILDNPLLDEISALKNLTIIGQGLYIHNNNNLSSLDGLQNVTLTSNTNFVSIRDCPALEDCAIANLCEFLENYHVSVIGNNAQGCNNREQVVEACSIPFDFTPRVEFLYDGFEDWSASGIPINWDEYFFDEYQGVPNIEKVPALIEGDYALALRSNIPFFEGNWATEIEMDFDSAVELIDISFTYKCLGEGSCLIYLGQSLIGSPEVNYRSVWLTIAGDPNQYTVVLQNINVNSPGSYFALVGLKASPVWTEVGSHGVSEFIVDDFLITVKGNPTSSLEPEQEPFRIYPNPATSYLFVEAARAFDRAIIYDNLGRIMDQHEYDQQIDVSNLSSGLYLLVLEEGNERYFQRFVKH